jgi:hypothetical protein
MGNPHLQDGAAQAWQEDVRGYVAGQPITEGHAQRTKLADALLSASPTGPGAAVRWCAFPP